MLDKARASRRRRAKSAPKEAIPLLDTAPVKDLLRPITSHLPEWKKHLGAAINVGREKLGDAYAVVARAAASQKEAFEDRLAERKSRSRAAGGKK
jgi:hypothetical protein